MLTLAWIKMQEVVENTRLNHQVFHVVAKYEMISMDVEWNASWCWARKLASSWQASSSYWVREISIDAEWNKNCVEVEFTVVQAPWNKSKVLKGIRSIFTHFLS